MVEAAAIANKSRWAITHAIREGALPATRVGHPRTGAYFIDIDDLRRVYPPETRDSSKRARLKRMLSGNEFTESIAFAEKLLTDARRKSEKSSGKVRVRRARPSAKPRSRAAARK